MLILVKHFMLSLLLANPFVGTWRGTSTCLVRPSACKDEIAVYHIAISTPDSLVVMGNKVVNGDEEFMGLLPCTATATQLTCGMPAGARPGTWRFTLKGDTLDGGLFLPDGTQFRKIHVQRAPRVF